MPQHGRKIPGEMLPVIISYAQNHEDVLLHRLFGGQAEGVYLDVGASHPTLHSVTRAFYDRGWHGVNIEPQADLFQLLCQHRPRDINLQIGVAEQAGQQPFFLVHAPGDELGGLSTCDALLAEHYRRQGFRVLTMAIRVMTLEQICERHQLTMIDFLKVDVEGYELSVLRSMNWRRYRPRAIVVESTRPGTSEASHGEWEPLLLSHDYCFAYFDGLNRYYVRQEEASLAAALQVPVNPFDGFVRYDTAQLWNVHQQLDGLVDGTDPQTLRLGLWLARGLYRLKRALRLAERSRA